MTGTEGDPGALPTFAQLKERPGSLGGTAWGVFGEDDELGTVNLLTRERVLRARDSIVHGDVFALNLPLDAFDPPLIAHRGNPRHDVFGLNQFHRDDRIDGLFPQASTQIDGLRHFAHPDHGFYNGVAGDEIRAGTARLGVQHLAERGIAGRGVVLDLDAYRSAVGRPIDDDTSEHIPIADVESALRWQGTVIEDGDILLIRTGWLTRARTRPRPADGRIRSAGLAAAEETAAWLWDRRIAVVAADNIALEPWPADPARMPTDAEGDGRLAPSTHTGMLHRTLIPLLGLAIGELWDLDALAAACARRGRFDCFVTAQPLNITGGVGSPANAIAII
ncbi:cyclase family protein [Microbacterium sp. NPDC055683]